MCFRAALLAYDNYIQYTISIFTTQSYTFKLFARRYLSICAQNFWLQQQQENLTIYAARRTYNKLRRREENVFFPLRRVHKPTTGRPRIKAFAQKHSTTSAALLRLIHIASYIGIYLIYGRLIVCTTHTEYIDTILFCELVFRCKYCFFFFCTIMMMKICCARWCDNTHICMFTYKTNTHFVITNRILFLYVLAPDR